MSYLENDPHQFTQPPSLQELGILPSQKFNLLKKIARTLGLLLGLLTLISSFALVQYLKALGVFHVSPQQIESIAQMPVIDNTEVYDRHGQRIGEYFRRYQIYLPYEKIPLRFIQALLSIEDRNFYTHPGIDVKAMLRATIAYIRHNKITQGASTITQQLVRRFLLNRDKTIHRKLKEIALALRAETILDKKQILESYVNNMFLGYGSYGIAAASYRYFGKSIDQLNIAELAMIAGLFQSPSRYNPHRYPKRAKARQEQVLYAMYKNHFLSAEEYAKWRATPLRYYNYQPLNKIVAPYFIDYIREQAQELLGTSVEGKGFKIYTTLDTRLQKLAYATLQNNKELLSRADQLIVPDYRKIKRGTPLKAEVALLSIDPRNGEILAMIGGRDYEESKYNRSIQAKRQPGSAFKPIVASLALRSGMRWSDVFFVAPIQLNGYRPKNFSNSFYKETTLLQAFYRSYNTVMIEVGGELGIEPIIEYAESLGIRSPLKKEPGTIIGSSEVSMPDLARAFATFANYGKRTELMSITKITDLNNKIIYQAPALKERQKQIISPQLAYLTTQGMREVIARGTAARASHLARWAVGKTGTSNNSIDNWFIGYSTNLLTVVWVGTDQQLTMRSPATGGSLALPLWEDYMTQAFTHVRRPGLFPRPKGIMTAFVDPQFGYTGARGIRMFFLKRNPPQKNTRDYDMIEEKGHYRTLFDF